MLLFLVTFIGAILIFEVFAHFSHIGDTARIDYFEDVGHALRKNHKFVTFSEGFCINETNRDGFLGEQISRQKPENTFRVALMGDSFIEALQVFERDYFGEIAEEKLKAQFPNRQFEFLNFGLSGFDIADIYAYQNNLVDRFDPDFIVYLVSNNDLTPQYRDRLRPRTIIIEDSLTIDMDIKKSATQDYTFFLTQNSHFFQMLNKCRLKARNVPVGSILLDKFYSWFPSKENSIPASLEFQLHAVTKKILENVDANKVIICNRDSLSLPTAFIRECELNGIKTLDLAAYVDDQAIQHKELLYWPVHNKYGHWNRQGHQVMGEFLATEISKIPEVQSFE